MSEQKFEKGQLILASCFDGPWHIYQYFGEDDERIFVLGGSFSKENNEIIPYEGNEYLLGTTDNPKPKWQPKPGELVAVANREESDGFFAVKSCPDHTTYDRYLYCEPLRKHFNVPEE